MVPSHNEAAPIQWFHDCMSALNRVVSLHSLVPLEEKFLVVAAPEDLDSLVSYLCYGGQLDTFEKGLVVRYRNQSAHVR